MYSILFFRRQHDGLDIDHMDINKLQTSGRNIIKEEVNTTVDIYTKH